MPENIKLRLINKNLPVKVEDQLIGIVGDQLIRLSKDILENEDPEEWYLKGKGTEISKPEFPIYCFDKTLLFDNSHYKADFRLAYLYYSVDNSLFLKHWRNAIKMRFSKKHFKEWDGFFEDVTISKKELAEISNHLISETSPEMNLVNGQSFILQKEWKAAIEEFEKISTFSLKNEVFYLMKGFALMQINDFDKASRAFEFAIEINGEYTPAKIGIQKALHRQGIFDYKNNKVAITHSKEIERKRKLQKLKEVICYDNEFFFDTISNFYPLPNVFLEKYSNELNWRKLTINKNLQWSKELINRFKDKWHWSWISGSLFFSTFNFEDISKYGEYGYLADQVYFWRLTDSLINEYADYLNWEQVSQNRFISLSDTLIEEYASKFNWDNLSANEALPWSNDLIDKYYYKWNWKRLSYNKSLPWSIELVERYRDKWDFHGVAVNKNLQWDEILIDLFDENWHWWCGCLAKNESIPWTEMLLDKYYFKWNWKGLSINEGLPWSEELLNNYEDRWDWNKLSSNSSLPWSIELIENYKERWDWKEMSSNNSLSWSIELIAKYRDKWDWNKLSSNSSLPWTIELVKNYKEKWNWNELSSNSSLPWTLELIENFKNKWNWRYLSRRSYIYFNLFSGLSLHEIEELMEHNINHFKIEQRDNN